MEGVKRDAPTKSKPLGRITRDRTGETRSASQRPQHRRSSLKCYHEKNGTHMKPEGPVPKGMKWDYHLGEWVLTAAAQRAAERAAERAAKAAAKAAAKKAAAKKPASRKRADIPEAPLSEYELQRRANIERTTRRPRVDRPSRT